MYIDVVHVYVYHVGTGRSLTKTVYLPQYLLTVGIYFQLCTCIPQKTTK